MRRVQFVNNYVNCQAALFIVLALYSILTVILVSNVLQLQNDYVNVSADTLTSTPSFVYDDDFYEAYANNLNKVSLYVNSSSNTDYVPTESGQIEILDEVVEVPTIENSAITINEMCGVAVATTAVRVRKDASTESEVLTTLYPGNTISVTGKTDLWYAVELNGEAGWVYSKYLDLQK